MESQPADQGSTPLAGPWVLVATLCQSVYCEGGRVSIQGIVNGISQNVPNPDDPSKMAPVRRTLLLFVMLAAGDFRGDGQVGIDAPVAFRWLH